MLLLAAMLVALAPAASYAKGGEEVIRDCAEDGDLDGEYSQEELDEASENMPSDLSEYSTCRDVIERARQNARADSDRSAGPTPAAASPPSDGSGGAGAGGKGNDADELATRRANSRDDKAPTASVAGEEVASSGGTFTTDAESDGMPVPLIVALALAALAAFLGALYLLRDQLPPAITSRLPGPLKPDSQV
jgi:cobalamin biosynthesis Mg chelatase CobN